MFSAVASCFVLFSTAHAYAVNFSILCLSVALSSVSSFLFSYSYLFIPACFSWTPQAILLLVFKDAQYLRARDYCIMKYLYYIKLNTLHSYLAITCLKHVLQRASCLDLRKLKATHLSFVISYSQFSHV